MHGIVLTGVSFDKVRTSICIEESTDFRSKLNYFHRITARTLCLLIWIHVAGRVSIRLFLTVKVTNSEQS